MEGDKIKAIRLLREATGLGLKASKDTIEALERAPEAAPHPPAPHAPAFPFSTALPPAVLQALHAGQTIQAIRLLREATGMGLKQAADTIRAHQGTTQPQLAPGEQPPGKDGLWWLLVGAVVMGAVLIWHGFQP